MCCNALESLIIDINAVGMIIQKDEEKSKRRIPPKQTVKSDTFMGIQLKPVARDPKAAQKAKSEIELKVKNVVFF